MEEIPYGHYLIIKNPNAQYIVAPPKMSKQLEK